MAVIKIESQTLPPQAPNAGFVKLWSSGTNIKYITSDGIVRTVSTGITREEVEDIISESFVNSSSITWTYDDTLNSFTAVIEASLLTKINNAVQVGDNVSTLTNDSDFRTGAQVAASVSAHSSLSNNPHSVTKAQVGLGNVPDVDTRSRSTHTGTQAASTISDFLDTVRSTVLTGLSVVSGSAVVAGDSILAAIGKIQGQLDVLNARVFGTQAEDFLNSQQVNFSGAISKLRFFTTQSKPVGRYRISANIQYKPAAANGVDFFELRVNGVRVGLRYEVEPKDNGVAVRDIISLTGYHAQAVNGAFDIEVWGGNTTGTTELRGVVAEVWRVS